MAEVQDIHVEAVKLQKDIEKYIGLGNSSVVFEYHEIQNQTKIDCITVNANHNQSFLFHSTYGIDKIDGLKKLLDYVKNYKELDSSFTIQWTLRGDNELYTSYFRAKDIMDALAKLNYGREPNSIVVYSVVLNPIT